MKQQAKFRYINIFGLVITTKKWLNEITINTTIEPMEVYDLFVRAMKENKIKFEAKIEKDENQPPEFSSEI